MSQSAAPVYLEKEPSEVSIPLQRTVRKIVKPEEVIEEYLDEEGRQVKRISKVTTTKTITSSERRLLTQKMDVDVPSEPGEDVEEYTDEYGQRVRRVVRTSLTTTPKTVLRDGAVKVVLKPGDHGQRELREGPEETERIQTFTSDDGRRTQKLTKTTLTTRLKRPVQPVTVQLPSPGSLPIHEDDQSPMDQDEHFNLAKVERNVSFPEWLETVKEKPSTTKEISLSSIQVESPQPVLPTVHVPERQYIVEELSATVAERHQPVISPLDLEEDKESPEIRDRKRIQPPEGLSGISEIPRKRAYKEPSATPPMERDADPEVEIDDEQDEAELSEDHEADEFNEEIVVLKVKTRPVAVPDEPEEPLKADGLDYPERITSSVSQVKERPEIKEDVSSFNIERKVTIPVLSSSFDNEAPVEVDEVKDDPYQTVKKEARQIEPVEVTIPVVPSEEESPEDVEEYIDENGVRVRRIVRRYLTTTATTTIKREDEGVERAEMMSPVAPSEDESPEEIEESIDENGVRVTRIVRRTITTRSMIRTAVDEAKAVPGPKVFESAAPVYLDSDDVVPSVQTREVALPEWMEESEPASEEPRQPRGDISFLTLPSQSEERGSKEDLDSEGVMERVTSTTLHREMVVPEIERMEDEPSEKVDEYVDENGVRVRRIVRRTITTSSFKRESQRTEPAEVKLPVAQAEDKIPEEVEEYIDGNGVRVRRMVKRIVTTATMKREGPEVGPVEVKFPVTPSDDESSEDVEEYVDESGVRVRRIVRRTITTGSIIHTSLDDAKDCPGAKMFESTTAPVYLDSDDVVSSVQTREVVLPEWMEEKEPASEEPTQRTEDITFVILPSQPRKPESKGDLDSEDVMERVTSTTLNREVIMPEIDGMEDESPEEVEEYVDENGVRVRRVVRRTITTTSIKREGQRTEPVEIRSPVTPSEGESPEEVEEYVDENGVRVRRVVRRTITTTSIKREGQRTEPVEVRSPVTPSEGESPEEVEEYVDENGVRVRRIVKRTITTATIKREGLGTGPVEVAFPVTPSLDESAEEVEEPAEVKFPVAPAEDESPEEVEEYVDENGVRVRKLLKRIVTTSTIKRQGPGIGLVEAQFPITPSEDESPEDVEEYIDENGVRVRRIVRRTITTRSIMRSSVDEAKDDPGTKMFGSAAPVYLDSDDVVSSVHTRDVVLPEWMEESEPASEEPRQPAGDISFAILPSYPTTPELKENLDREDVMERVTSTTLNREIVIPEFEGIDDESPQDVKEYVDENGVRAMRLVRKTITTTTIKRESQATEPTEVKFPVAPSEDESPEEVEEYIDDKGVRVRRIVKLVTTATIKSEGSEIGPVEVKFPVTTSEDESPEVEEYIDENGVRVRRTITTRSIIRTSVEAKGDPGAKMFESEALVHSDADDAVPSVQRREVVLPEWMDASEPASEEPRQPAGDISFLILPSQPKEPVPREDIDRDDLMERVTSTTLNREIIMPEIDGTEDKSPEEVEEYVDDRGVRVRRIARRTITTTSIKREGQRTEPAEVKFPVALAEGESPEEVEEYIDENGVRVRRIVKRIIATETIKRQGPGIGLVEAKDESPEEVEEYIDENGVRVRRIVRRTITTRSIMRSSVDEGKDDPGTEMFESAAPVYLDSDDVVSSVQTREVVLPEWMEESEPATEEPRQLSGDISFLILPSQPREPESKGDHDSQDVMERVTSTTLNREVVIPEIEGMEDEPSEEVDEYVDENGVRVRRFARRTITTTSIKRESQRSEPAEVTFPVAQSEDEIPEEVEEYIDENGVRVRRIVKRIVTTATIKSEGPEIGPVEVQFPVTPSEDESPEEVEEYIDEHGDRVRRIVRRTITTRSIIRTSVGEAKDGPGAKILETAEPVYLDSDDVVPSVQTREVVLPGWMEESEPASEEPKQPTGDISVLIQPSQPKEPESKEDLDHEGVMERVTSTTFNREIVIPEIEGMEDESPKEVEEYVYENGVRVKRIVRRTIKTTSIKREDQRTEPAEVKFPLVPSDDEPQEEFEEYTDENGVRVRRMVKRTITTTIRRQAYETEPMAVEFPVKDGGDISPDEFVEEYTDENGVTVKRIVRRTTTATVQRSVLSEEGVGPAGLYQVTEEVAPRKEIASVEAIAPETVLFTQMQAISPRRESIPYETAAVQRYLVIIETLYQYVLEHKSMIFIYSSRYMQFNFVLENFLQWMLVTLKTLSWMRPVSWKADEVKDQLQKIKVFLSVGMCVDLHDGSQCC